MHTLDPRLWIPILNALIPLQQPHNRIPRLRQRKLLAHADPRPAIERQVSPSDAAREIRRLPARGVVEFCVGAVQVGPSVHGVGAVEYDAAGGDEDGGFAGGTAAEGDGGGADGVAGVAGDGGEEAEC